MRTHSTGPGRARSASVAPPRRQRLAAGLAAVFVAATAVLFWPGGATPAAAAPVGSTCAASDWQDPKNFDRCVANLPEVSQQEAQCLQPPVPERPDRGMAGWFATEPDSSKQPGPKGLYSRYGYGGYGLTTYDNGCVSTNIADTFGNKAAEYELGAALWIVGAADALRESAWQPQNLWGWANPLVDKATKSVYRRVFTVFGTITLGVVGLYLLWRSRQSDMSSAMTTAGWAILVMVAVTAIAAWPVRSANVADQSLVTGLNVVHDAVGPPPANTPLSQCTSVAGACQDHRPPAVRASDTAVETIIYRNWLRDELGSATSPTAQKYGLILYDSKTLTWDELWQTNGDPTAYNSLIGVKKQHWMRVAKQIKSEDPEAYQYLQGARTSDRVGSGIIAILSALFFAMFDITASVLVLLGFLIFRWAVIAAPILGTIGLLRPASAGLRRLLNAVVAAIFNIIIFGTGAAIYLFAVDLIMGTVTLPGWLQVVLVWLTGVVGWLLLRPYRRITQLGGKDPVRELAMIGSWNRRFARDVRDTPRAPADPLHDRLIDSRLDRRGVLVVKSRTTVVRPETRTEDVPESTRGGSRTRTVAGRRRAEPVVASRRPEDRRMPEDEEVPVSVPARRPQRWTHPDVQDGPSQVAIYRPDSSPAPAPTRRPESATVRG
jgi:hypothetical protein